MRCHQVSFPRASLSEEASDQDVFDGHSIYNSSDAVDMRNIFELISMRITMQVRLRSFPLPSPSSLGLPSLSSSTSPPLLPSLPRPISLTPVIFSPFSQGFICLDHLSVIPHAMEMLKKAIGEGKYIVEGTETSVPTKFEDVPETWQMLFTGGNQGKLIAKLV